MVSMTRALQALSIVTAIALVMALSSCTPEREALSPPDASPTPSVSSGPETEAPSPAPVEPSVTGIPFGLDCKQVLTADAMYLFNPNVGTDPAFDPSALAEEALAYGGVACGWINQTSSDTFSVAVARFDEVNLAAIRAEAASAPGAVALIGTDGFFTMTSGVGIVEAFIRDYWVVVESPAFRAPGDAEDLLGPLRDSLN